MTLHHPRRLGRDLTRAGRSIVTGAETLLLLAAVRLQSALLGRRGAGVGVTTRVRNDAGQTVAEYALVLLVAAAIAGSFLLWAKQSGRLDAFFDAIFERLLGSVDPEATPTPAP